MVIAVLAAAAAAAASTVARSTDPYGSESRPEIVKLNGRRTVFDIYIYIILVQRIFIPPCLCVRIRMLCLIVDVEIRKKTSTEDPVYRVNHVRQNSDRVTRIIKLYIYIYMYIILNGRKCRPCNGNAELFMTNNYYDQLWMRVFSTIS